MKSRLTLFAVMFYWLANPVFAHRLDEYLQATTIAVEKDRLVLQLRLTPGIAVAGQVLASLDANGDGTISDAEQRVYAEKVCQDLSLADDGDPLPLRLVSSSFLGMEEMTKGLGGILLTFEADLPVLRAAAHRLTFENRHQRAISVYLVNSLLPNDPGIHVVAQDRSNDQARYQLDFTVEDSPLPPSVAGVRSLPPKASGP